MDCFFIKAPVGVHSQFINKIVEGTMRLTLSLKLVSLHCYAPTRPVLTDWLSICLRTKLLWFQIPLLALHRLMPESNSQLFHKIQLLAMKNV